MTVYYRDEYGIVAEEMSDGESGNSIDMADGYAYFTVVCDCGDTVELFDRKIPLNALVRIDR